MRSPKLFSLFRKGRRVDVAGYLSCKHHYGERKKCDIRKFRSEEQLRMR